MRVCACVCEEKSTERHKEENKPKSRTIVIGPHKLMNDAIKISVRRCRGHFVHLLQETANMFDFGRLDDLHGLRGFFLLWIPRKRIQACHAEPDRAISRYEREQTRSKCTCGKRRSARQFKEQSDAPPPWPSLGR